MSQSWLRIAHRGASGTAPEHTRAAFERALSLGVDMIELDVQLTRDGEIVVVHDLTLERTTTGAGAVRDHTLAELKSLDAGGWFSPCFAGEPILTLDEVLDLVGTRARLNIEIKAVHGDWPALATALLHTLRRRGLLEATILSSFEAGALAAVRGRDRGAVLGLLWQAPSIAEALSCAAELGVWSIHPHWMLVSAEFVRQVQDGGWRVITWTVNDVGTMRDLVRAGVSGIISDFPERFAAVGE